MLIIVIGLIIILVSVAVIGASIAYNNAQRNKRIEENRLRVRNEIADAYNAISEEGVNSIKKGDLAQSLLPKNEILYYSIYGMIEKQKTLASGNIKVTTEGRGQILISDKAITIETNALASGKRRFLYKNIHGNKPTVIDSEYGTKIGFYYNGKNLIFLNIGSKMQLEAIVMAFFLKNNPIRDDDSISF